MPELPEAEIVARQLRAALLGATLSGLWVGRPDIVREGYAEQSWYWGSNVESVVRYGKSVVFGFRKQHEVRYIVVELGMTGLLLFPSVTTKYPEHVHVRLAFDGGRETEVRYWNSRRFGRVEFLDEAGLARYIVRRFGCDPLSISCKAFSNLIKNRKGKIKSLLMKQQNIAGIGNIYANEILFRVPLHPDAQVSQLSDAKIASLYRAMQTVLQEAIMYGGSSVKDFIAPDGTEGKYKRYHLVYGKEHELCPNRCGRVIRRLHGERSSFICPNCQRLR